MGNVTTIREAVDLAPRRFVHVGRQRRLLELKGTGAIRSDYDYKRVRSGA